MRYFIFYYAFKKPGNEFGYGNSRLTSKQFPSEHSIIESLKNKFPDCEFIISGFNEFKNKKDYENFCSFEGTNNTVS